MIAARQEEHQLEGELDTFDFELADERLRTVSRTIPLDFEPSSLLWDPDDAQLYIADDTHDRVLAWSRARGFTLVADLLGAGGVPSRLGQITRGVGGELLVPTYGRGETGTIFCLSPTHPIRILSALDVRRKRLGLCRASDGGVYECYFVDEDGFRIGAVARVGELGGEIDLVAGLKKPVGLIEFADALIVSDQARHRLLRVPMMIPSFFTCFAHVPAPDAMCRGPAGTLLVASKAGKVCVLGTRGEVRDLVVDLDELHGVAYDPEAETAYVAERVRDPSGGRTHALHVIEDVAERMAL
jgi:hypothetical protein